MRFFSNTTLENQVCRPKSGINLYPFGMEMPGRKWTSANYRYGMNGQEADKEIFEGAYTAEFWEYDSRTGRRWNTDPISYAFQSPYATFNNNPIYYADPLGLEGDGDGNKGDGGKKGGGGNSGETITKNPDGSTSSTITWGRGGSCTVNTPGETDAPSKSSGGSKAPAFSLNYGVPGGIYGTKSTLGQLYGDRKYNYYHTPFNNANGGFSVDEPNVFLQLQGRVKGQTEWSFLMMKQKIEPFNGLKIEAPTALEFGLATRKQLYNKSKWLAISLDLSATLGVTYGAPMFNNSQDDINFSGLTLKAPQTERYMHVGNSGTLLARVNAKFIQSLTIFTAINLHHLQGTWINTTSGGQKVGYLGSAEITFGVGFDVGPKGSIK